MKSTDTCDLRLKAAAWILLVTLFALPCFGQEESASSESSAKPSRLALVGATIYTQASQGKLSDGVVLIKGEKIEAVGGPGLEVPEGVRTIDVTGMSLTPGWIDADSRLWLTSAAASSSASNASLDAVDGVDPFSEQWQEVIRQGVTSVYVQPTGTLGGYGAVLSVTPGETGPVILRPAAALQASLGQGASNNRSRSQQFDRTKKAFDDAEAYQQKWDEYQAYVKKQEQQKREAASKKDVERPPSPNRQKSGKRSRGPSDEPDAKSKPDKPEKGRDRPEPSKDAPSETDKAKEKTSDAEKQSKEDKRKKPPEKPEFDKSKEQLAKVVRGKIPLRLEIHTADDAHYALKLLEEFPKLQVVWTGVTDLRSAAHEVTDLGLPVVLGPWLDTESNYRRQPDSRQSWLQRTFADYPGTLVIASRGTNGRGSRLLRAHVGRAVSAGLDPQRALAAVTIDAARTLGVAKSLGSIEPGKQADLAGFVGSPIDASAPVGLVISRGAIVHEADADQAPFAGNSQQLQLATATESVDLRAPVIAIKSQHVLQSDGSTAAGLVLIDTSAGTIRALKAASSELDPQLPVWDVGQAWVTPGLFFAHGNLGLTSLVDPQVSDATYVVAADAVSPGFAGERALLRQGVLRGLLAPSNTNTLAGQLSVLRIAAKEAVLQREAAVKFSLTDEARSPNRFPSSLAGQLQLINESLAGQLLDERLYLPTGVQSRLAASRRAPLQAVLEGKPTWIAAQSDVEIRAALDLVEQHGLKAALVGAAQLEPFVPRLAELGVTVIARPLSTSDYNWYPSDLAAAARAGIAVGFAGDSGEQLRLTAASAVAAGMPRTAALAGLCFGPQMFRQPWQPGQPADLVIWSGSPLNLAATPLATLVDGRVVSTAASQRGTDGK